MRYAFDDYTLAPEHYELRQAGRLVRLEPRVFDLLVYLVQHPGRTVTKEELLEQLWPNQCVTDDSLTTAVARVRRALHDTGQAQRYIQTVRRRGYRFIASIEVLQQVETDARRPPTADPPMPTEQNALDHVDTGSPPPPVQPVPPSAPPPALDPVRAPRIGISNGIFVPALGNTSPAPPPCPPPAAAPHPWRLRRSPRAAEESHDSCNPANECRQQPSRR
jgi:DNA-binding winged helix-turn-helix (wHTH) protein